MAQGNRSKEVWLVPKRGSLHQTVYLLQSIVNRRYDNTTWNQQKQNNIGNDLRKMGATRYGRTISNQSVRTLAASIPQYLGFLYIDTNTTPNTIKITEAGYQLLDVHSGDIRETRTLSDARARGYLIEESPILRNQFEKLQLTNPIELPHCENILVFPFRFTLKLLLELEYLDREELAYIVFHVKDETEYNLTVEKIKAFRRQNYEDRVRLIDRFKETHIGNITLVQAPSAGYFVNLCKQTGIIDLCSIEVPNPNNDLTQNPRIPAIKIKQGCTNVVEFICNEKYENAQVYDFKDDLYLWISYIGNPNRLIPPRNIYLCNTSHVNMIMLVRQDNNIIGGDLVTEGSTIEIPAYLGERYEVECIDPQSGEVIEQREIIPTSDTTVFDLGTDTNENDEDLSSLSAEEIAQIILEHSASRDFDRRFLDYLNVLSRVVGIDFTQDNGLRGGRYEYLFYLLLNELFEENIIDDVVWNSQLGRYGMPRPAPGGRTGIPDIYFSIYDKIFVLEVTTIKPKSTQFNAEGASVPDHIRLFAEANNCKPVGIFCAPLIHERNTNAMKAVLDQYDINIACLTDSEFIEILLSRDKEYIYDKLIEISNQR